ncbi:MAG TPA: SDR family NAD(P)-dependent oxidoreductase [Anaerolineae bacterium]|nr:SDR family NAD(P)-dependent oxidoreductase [Anaerolineae bacterium]
MSRDYSSFQLTDQVAIVTGASQGIGQTLSVGLAEAGAHVALVARTVPKLEAVASEIEALGRKALVVPTDVTDVAQIQAMVDKVQSTLGRIDILVNNAAWTDTVPALEVTEEEWDRTLDTSLKGLFFTSQAAARVMIEQGRGKIINIGSTFGVVTFKGRPVYAAAKAAVHHLTRALALEWASQGVNVNAVGPCLTETPTRRFLFERSGFVEWVTGEELPIGRWAQPEDMLGAVLYLASPLSDMVVGHVLMVDGGWTIH